MLRSALGGLLAAAVAMALPAPAAAHGGCVPRAFKPVFDPGGPQIATVRARGRYACDELHGRTTILVRLQSYEDGRWQTAAEDSRTVRDGFVAGWRAQREYSSCAVRTYRTVAIGTAGRRHRGHDVSAKLRVGCG